MQMELPSNSSVVPELKSCYASEIQATIVSLLVAYVLLMPLFFYVLVVGCQRWRREGLSSPFTSWSHIDVFTYNVVVLDLLQVLGTFLFFFGVVTDKLRLQQAGGSMFCICIPGQTLFHLLTCMERYLAVVHPVLYLRLKGSAGFWIRNVTIGCVWLISIVAMSLMCESRITFPIINGLVLSFSSVAFFFCSLYVLCALIRPGPGEGGVARGRVDQSKQRALHTLIITTGTLFLRFICSLIAAIVQNVENYFEYVYCLTSWSSLWFLVPSSLVLPLLLLQRTGKLKMCGANIK